MITKYGICRRCKGSGYFRITREDGSTDISVCPVCHGNAVTEIKPEDLNVEVPDDKDKNGEA